MYNTIFTCLAPRVGKSYWLVAEKIRSGRSTCCLFWSSYQFIIPVINRTLPIPMPCLYFAVPLFKSIMRQQHDQQGIIKKAVQTLAITQVIHKRLLLSLASECTCKIHTHAGTYDVLRPQQQVFVRMTYFQPSNPGVRLPNCPLRLSNFGVRLYHSGIYPYFRLIRLPFRDIHPSFKLIHPYKYLLSPVLYRRITRPLSLYAYPSYPYQAAFKDISAGNDFMHPPKRDGHSFNPNAQKGTLLITILF
jgi:hypothetical protein